MKKKPSSISYIVLSLSVLLVFIFKNNLTQYLPAGILPDTTARFVNETGAAGRDATALTAADAFGGGPGGLVMGSPLDINTATEEVLKLVPGIGERLAGRIIAARLERGGFSDIGELTAIKGISDGKLNTLKVFLRVAPAKQSER